MIVSTVRSGGTRLGFVNNARVSGFSKESDILCDLRFSYSVILSIPEIHVHFQRFNVMITRAKCLLIIVGDPHCLQYDSNWNKLIEYCLENNAMIQSIYRYPF